MGQVAAGSYVGDGTDARSFIGLGARPALVLVKAEAATYAVARSATMADGMSKALVLGDPLTTGALRSLDADGFTMGTDPAVNATGVTFDWLAFAANNAQIASGQYDGDNAPSRTVAGLPFSPGCVWVIPDGTGLAVFITSDMVDGFSRGFDSSRTSGEITALVGSGFQVGLPLNALGVTYHYLAWSNAGSVLSTGAFTGNGNTGRVVGGVGFLPGALILKGDNHRAAYRTAVFPPALDRTLPFDAFNSFSGGIVTVQSGDFEIDNRPEVNLANEPYYWMAWPANKVTLSDGPTGGGGSPDGGTGGLGSPAGSAGSSGLGSRDYRVGCGCRASSSGLAGWIWLLSLGPAVCRPRRQAVRRRSQEGN